MKPKFMEAISDGDLITIRLYLANELLLDPRGKSFNKMRAYAEMNIMDLYDVMMDLTSLILLLFGVTSFCLICEMI